MGKGKLPAGGEAPLAPGGLGPDFACALWALSPWVDAFHILCA